MTFFNSIFSLLFACLLASPQAPAFDEHQGLAPTAILDVLPAGDTVRTIRGADFHYGVIDDASGWKPVATALAATGSIDWDTQSVVYVILAEHTNALDLANISVDAGGVATVSVEWIGIEPYYPDHVPAVFKVLNRTDISDIALAIR